MIFSSLYVNLLITIYFVSENVFAQSCGPKVKPRFLVGIPCDMSKSTFCPAAGSAYPWNSLRRYIYENQGLMRRMYGDERHSIILHSDLQTRSYTSWSSEKIRTGRISLPDKKDFLPIPDDILPERYRRGNSTVRTAPKTSSTPNDTTSTTSSTQKVADVNVTTTNPTSTHPSSQTQDANETYETVTGTVPTTVEQTTVEDDTYQYPGTASLLESEYEEDYDTVSTTFPKVSTTPLTPTSAEAPSLQDVITGQPSSIVEDRVYYNTQTVEESHVLSTNSVEEKDVSPEVTDSNKKEEEKEPQKGFNACPVKEEVVAPYWANNTRGEILALLNVYPFEQYVHWEKCAYENHQMFCRDGCRCEQQFRLHRLLAFDPRNECRGIFADWFRFPSCCVCVCYNLTDTVPKA